MTTPAGTPSAPPRDIEWGLYESAEPKTGEAMLGVSMTATLEDGRVVRNAARIRVDAIGEAVDIGKRQLRMWLEEYTQCLPLPAGIERVRGAGVSGA